MKIIRDLINGNLTSAKKSAKNVSHALIVEKAKDEHGMSENHAIATADYLKGRITFWTYCERTK